MGGKRGRSCRGAVHSVLSTSATVVENDSGRRYGRASPRHDRRRDRPCLCFPQHARRARRCEHLPLDRLMPQRPVREDSEREQRRACDIADARQAYQVGRPQPRRYRKRPVLVTIVRPITATISSSTSRAKLIQQIRRLNEVPGLGAIWKAMINRTEQLIAFVS